ncbi:MAG: protein arginine kinase [Planctomycetota bacterium]
MPPPGSQPSTPPNPPHHPHDESGVEWLRGEGAETDVVLSSRVRLARNLTSFPFANRASSEQRQEILDISRSAVRVAGIADRTLWLNIHETSPADRALLVERHIISKQLQRGRAATVGEDPRGVCVSLPVERVSIMVNEEDHLRLQVVRSGLALDEAWRQADGIDDALESAVDYAYSPRLGYLTACATNVGTGLRMSAMLHLPALKITGDIEKVKKAAGDMCLAVRGFYGEGSEAVGDLYQISNQTTLGKTEAMILADLHERIIPQVIEYERLARKTLLTKRSLALHDQVYRSLGLLTSARLIAAEEAMQHLSLVRLGICTGLVKHLSSKTVAGLMLLVQPAHLQRTVGRELDQDARREARATLLRERLSR